MKYLSQHSGQYYIRVINLGQNSTGIEVDVTVIEDCDDDILSDFYELNIGTNVYYYDTDGRIPDNIDWYSEEHWLSAVVPVSLISIIFILIIFSFMKYRLYQKAD